MNHASPRRAILTWLFLMTATLSSAWLAEHQGLAGRSTAAVVMLVAAIKVHLVMRHFMELSQAPRLWRLTFAIWTGFVCSIILVIYFLSLAP